MYTIVEPATATRVIALKLRYMGSLIIHLKSSKSLLFFSNFLLFNRLLYFSKQPLSIAHEVVVYLIQVFLRQLCLLNTSQYTMFQRKFIKFIHNFLIIVLTKNQPFKTRKNNFIGRLIN